MITITISKRYRSSIEDLIPKILKDLEITDKVKKIFDKKRNDTTIEIKVTRHNKILIVPSSPSDDARNVWLSQPILNISKYNDITNIYLYNRSTVKATDRNLFDIRCLKTFGVRFLGIDKIIKNKTDEFISNISKFYSVGDFIDDFSKLQKVSEKKNNNITEVLSSINEYGATRTTIKNGKTEGATKGSFFILILGLRKISDRLDVWKSKKNQELSPRDFRYLKELYVNFTLSETEIDRFLKETETENENARKSGRDFQQKCTNNCKVRVGSDKCELTDDDNNVITSHIIPYNYGTKLFELKKISEEIYDKICMSSDNSLRIANFLDGLFDKGEMTFDNNGNIIMSKTISEINKRLLSLVNKKLNVTEKMEISLYFHRKYVFKDNKSDIKDITDEEITMLEKL